MDKRNSRPPNSSDNKTPDDFNPFLMLSDAGEPPPSIKRVTLWEKTLETLRHPFVLLVLGTIISTIIVPIIVSKSNQKKLLAETRVKKALEIVDKNSLFERQLYSFYSRLGLFHQQNIDMKPKPDDLKNLQEELRKDTIKRYTEDFKDYTTQYIWVDDLYKQAIIMELLPQDNSEKVENTNATPTPQASSSPTHDDKPILAIHIKEYKDNITDSLGALRKFWERCISDQYEFDPNGSTSKIQLDTTKQLNNLLSKRTEIVNNLVKDFTPQ